MRIIASGVFCIVSFILQSTLFSQFNIGGIVPNLLLIVTATIGFIIGRKYGMVTGFVAGLLTDIFFGSVIGFYALMYMYIGYLNGTFKKILYPGDFKLPLLLIVGSDVIYSHAVYFFMFFIQGQFHYAFYLKKVILPEVVYTTVIACILYPIMKFFFNKIDKWEQKVAGESV